MDVKGQSSTECNIIININSTSNYKYAKCWYKLPLCLAFLYQQLSLSLFICTPFLKPSSHLFPRLGCIYINCRYNPSNIQRATKARQISKALSLVSSVQRPYTMFAIGCTEANGSTGTSSLRFQLLMRERCFP